MSSEPTDYAAIIADLEMKMATLANTLASLRAAQAAGALGQSGDSSGTIASTMVPSVSGGEVPVEAFQTSSMSQFGNPRFFRSLLPAARWCNVVQQRKFIRDFPCPQRSEKTRRLRHHSRPAPPLHFPLTFTRPWKTWQKRRRFPSPGSSAMLLKNTWLINGHYSRVAHEHAPERNGPESPQSPDPRDL
jgi:hypothetical protein